MFEIHWPPSSFVWALILCFGFVTFTALIRFNIFSNRSFIILFIVTWWRSKVIGRDGNSATNRKPISQPTRIWRPLRGKWLREVRQFRAPPDWPAIRRCNFHTLDLATGATLESMHIPIYKYWKRLQMNSLFKNELPFYHHVSKVRGMNR